MASAAPAKLRTCVSCIASTMSCTTAKGPVTRADQPTGSIDDKIAMRIMYLFEELNRMGTTVVIATHNDALVSRFSYPRLILADGGLIQEAG